MKRTIITIAAVLSMSACTAKETHEYFIPEHPTPGSSMMIQPSVKGSPTIIVSAGKRQDVKKKFSKARNRARNVTVLSIAPHASARQDQWITLAPTNSACFYNVSNYPISGSYTSTLMVFGYTGKTNGYVVLLPHESKCFSPKPTLTVKQIYMGQYPTWTSISANMDGNFADSQDYGELKIN